MEIDITHLMERKAEMIYYSASAAELGQDAGQVTWENTMDNFDHSNNPDSEWYLISDDDQLDELRSYIESFGAWNRDQIDSWSPHTLNALLLQFIAGDIREREHYVERDELDEYEENIGGRIYAVDDVTPGNQRWFYSVGN